ncbi:hypothetical protein SAMN05660860_02819 [Geoalkalibacter ferrihydriticus]|uniref:Uncharacterized protein n=1 Tax=Geoalkalibacter ferrihydriticus TaxID=392333 RepID=A0A1G9UF95_9BACT|nr:hypothetical protein SAMN05660860_02819 [Geoalkalibacter ferrihydriticus]
MKLRERVLPRQRSLPTYLFIDQSEAHLKIRQTPRLSFLHQA